MKKWQFVGTTALGATLLLGACGGGNGGSGNSDLKGEAKGDGSSTVAPIVEKLNEKWAQDHSDAKISAGQAGTGAGFQKFIAGDIDFADASRPIKDEEKQKLQDKNIKYKEFKIAQDGVTVAVNKEINAVSPNSSHGTYDFFENEVMNKEDIKAEKNADTNAIVSSV
ncbi:substrate-binding domain-containing protein, partial [Staphylococcus aureus]|nr:substrate-binding domain-containing protein [Staphylococcus aureus]